MLAPENRVMRVVVLAGWTYLTIRSWCRATVEGFGGNAIFQVVVFSLLLLVLQIAVVYVPPRSRAEPDPHQDREGDTNEC